MTHRGLFDWCIVGFVRWLCLCSREGESGDRQPASSLWSAGSSCYSNVTHWGKNSIAIRMKYVYQKHLFTRCEKLPAIQVTLFGPCVKFPASHFTGYFQLRFIQLLFRALQLLQLSTTGHCAAKSRVTGGIPTQSASNVKMCHVRAIGSEFREHNLRAVVSIRACSFKPINTVGHNKYGQWWQTTFSSSFIEIKYC